MIIRFNPLFIRSAPASPIKSVETKRIISDMNNIV